MRVVTLLISMIFLKSSALCQSNCINGPAMVEIGSSAYYEVSFDYTINPYTNFSWNVVGGTIISQNISNTTNISCTIEWNNYPTNGSVSLYDDLQGIEISKEIEIGPISIINDIIGVPTNRPTVSCAPLSNSFCNIIQNSNFNHAPIYDQGDPFSYGQIDNWVATHGTPQVYDPWHPTLLPPPSATGFAYMYASGPTISGGPNTGEGIAQKIKKMIPGNQYTLSFYARFSEWLTGATQLDNFVIKLINCTDLNTFPQSSNNIPVTPTNSQIIFQEINLNNPNWIYKSITFTATDEYDIIWMYPEQSFNGAGINVSQISLSNLTQGGTPTITPLSPTEQCVHYETGPWLTLTTNSLQNIQWYENGTPITGATSQNITLNGLPNNGIGNPNSSSLISIGNTITGCISSPIRVTRKNFYSPNAYPVSSPITSFETPNSYCNGIPGDIKQHPSLLNNNTTYWWDVLDPNGNSVLNSYAFISPNNSQNPFATITFSNYPFATATIIPKALENGCEGATNGSWNKSYIVSINSNNCRPISYYTNIVSHSNNFQKNKISITPNPAKNDIIVTSDYTIQDVRIYNINGQLIKNLQNVNSKTIKINIQTLKSGFYFFEIFTQIGLFKEKLIKTQ